LHVGSTGSNDFIEGARSAGIDLSGWSIALYDATTGTPSSIIPLSGVVSNQQNGYGVIAYSIPPATSQNDPPEGMALIDDRGQVVQFLSFGGAITAVSGPAAGMSSQDIGGSTSGTPASGHSAQLTSIGGSTGNSVWDMSSPATPGMLSSNQSFSTLPPGEPAPPVPVPDQPTVSVKKLADAAENGVPRLFRFTRTGDLSQELTVNYTIDGTATPGVDYVALSGSVTFAPQAATVDVGVAAYPDHAAEGDETVIASIVPPTGYGVGASSTAMVAIADKLAVDDNYGMFHDSTLTVSAAEGVLANDAFLTGATLQAVLLTQPTSGSVDFSNDGSFVYQPASGFVGTDTFTYQLVADGQPVDTATVSIGVAGEQPVVSNLSFSVHAGSTMVGNLLSSLSSGADPYLTVNVTQGPQHGTLTGPDASGSFEYRPNAGFTGRDTIQFQAVSGGLFSGIATATIDVTNTAPVANPDQYFVYLVSSLSPPSTNVLRNDSDPDGDPIQAVLVSQPRHAASFI